MRQLFVAALAAMFAGCASAPENPPFNARSVVELGRWPVQQDERQLGWVVLLEIQDPAGSVRFYRVENQRGQWLGHASLEGRFSRRVPFQDDEEDLGLYPMASGVQKLLAADKPVTVVGRPEASAVEAGMRKKP